MSDIKAMGLYRNVNRILADLAAAGLDPGDALTVDDLTTFDQYHYEGTDAVDDAISALGLDGTTNVLDVGSGLGGPARYMADRSGTAVTALELQADLHATATELTTRCRLDHLVKHELGDILSGIAGTDTYDSIVSMLCVLHIPDRAGLFERWAEALKPGGRIFIDDYVALNTLSPSDRDMLAEAVYCTYLPDRATYKADVENAGFSSVNLVDKTAEWTNFVNARYSAFNDNRSGLSNRYGNETVDDLDHFYKTIVSLFAGGNLGGLRLTAQLSD